MIFTRGLSGVFQSLTAELTQSVKEYMWKEMKKAKKNLPETTSKSDLGNSSHLKSSQSSHQKRSQSSHQSISQSSQPNNQSLNLLHLLHLQGEVQGLSHQQLLLQLLGPKFQRQPSQPKSQTNLLLFHLILLKSLLLIQKV